MFSAREEQGLALRCSVPLAGDGPLLSFGHWSRCGSVSRWLWRRTVSPFTPTSYASLPSVGFADISPGRNYNLLAFDYIKPVFAVTGFIDSNILPATTILHSAFCILHLKRVRHLFSVIQCRRSCVAQTFPLMLLGLPPDMVQGVLSHRTRTA